MRSVLLALVVAACGGGSKSSTTAPKDAGPTCTTVADSMVAMMAQGKESTKAFVDKKEGYTTIIRTRCTEDAWTADAKQCLSTMKNREDAERCGTLLTEVQQQNLVRDQQKQFEPPPQDPEPQTQAAPPAPAEAPKASKTKKRGDPCDGGE